MANSYFKCRISGGSYLAPSSQTYEQALLAWISHACAALKKRIIKELESSVPDEFVSMLKQSSAI